MAKAYFACLVVAKLQNLAHQWHLSPDVHGVRYLHLERQLSTNTLDIVRLVAEGRFQFRGSRVQLTAQWPLANGHMAMHIHVVHPT